LAPPSTSVPSPAFTSVADPVMTELIVNGAAVSCWWMRIATSLVVMLPPVIPAPPAATAGVTRIPPPLIVFAPLHVSVVAGVLKRSTTWLKPAAGDEFAGVTSTASPKKKLLEYPPIFWISPAKFTTAKSVLDQVAYGRRLLALLWLARNLGVPPPAIVSKRHTPALLGMSNPRFSVAFCTPPVLTMKLTAPSPMIVRATDWLVSCPVAPTTPLSRTVVVPNSHRSWLGLSLFPLLLTEQSR
jgi:hypothetical protein